MKSIKIRHSEAEDIPKIKAVYENRQLFAETLQLPFPSVEVWRERLMDLPRGTHSLVAYVDDELVGHLLFEANQSSRRKHVGSLAMGVKASHQGQGVGSELLRAAIDLAENWLNILRIELTVYAENEPAVALYKKYGFEVEGQAPRYAFRDGRYVSALYMARVTDDVPR
ncbi:GNAT family N-acetyltransferase [Salinisphaera sp. T5B8]|uniref:GNAT family N-acetyltransferase n=1 Tax=Salinisphaera sp. T5B8 TaxID=1304154 RepID=UPI0033428C29